MNTFLSKSQTAIISKEDRKLKKELASLKRKVKKERFNRVKASKPISDKISYKYIGTSKGEQRIINYLTKRKIAFIREYSPCDLLNNKKCKLWIDFYLPDYFTCIEFDGIQHFKASIFDTKTNTFKTRQKNDRIKDFYCRLKGLEMIRINYNQINQIEEIISNNLL